MFSMGIIKEWHGKGGSILARFYSCKNENNTVQYFVDFKMCTITLDVTCGLELDENRFYTYTGLYGLPFRYARFVYKKLRGIN